MKAEGEDITRERHPQAREPPAMGIATRKDPGVAAGLGKNAVKETERKRLKEKRGTGGETLLQREGQARIPGIDEVNLHSGYKYASLLIGMETGRIPWLPHGKRKAAVDDFIG